MVVTEALARGVPALATDVGGVSEALGWVPRPVTGPEPERAPRPAPRVEQAAGVERVRPGILVPPGDPAALAGALRRWLTQPDLRVSLRAAARARRSTLDGWDATARALSGVLRAL
jgi:glycosyltransferase involved in cell wall biosynthesis